MNNILPFIIALIAFPLSSNAQVVINEFLASNTIVNVDEEDYYNYNDWIEIFNSGDTEIDISGYGLTDDLNEPHKWTFPAGTSLAANDFLLIWADGENKVPGDTDSLILTSTVIFEVEDYHTNFKLSAQGETIGLYDSNGEQVDVITYGKQLGNTSYGRIINLPTQWAYFGTPTPEAVNNTIEAPSVIISEAVNHSPEGGVFSTASSVQLSTLEPDAVIRYTLDGSLPNENASIYSSPIDINSSSVIRSRTFVSGEIAGPINTQSYIIQNDLNLPTVSISTTEEDLWNLKYGIYQNSYKNREIPASIEMFDVNGEKLFGENTGVELFGSNIFNAQQKPFDLSFKGKYGNDILSYPVFEERGEINYKNFVLRNGGNDNGLTFFRDALVMSMIKQNKLNLDYQGFEPVAVYLNGAYWGIYNLREKLNERYVSYLHDVPSNKIDILEDNALLNHGTEDDYQALITFIENNDLSIPENYQYVLSQIDLDSYLDYKILKVFIGYWVDLVNLKYWKRHDNGKWRYMAFDLEHSFAELTGDSCQVNTLQKVSTNSTDLPEWSTLFFRKLLENESFKNEFVQRFLGYLETAFTTDSILEIINDLEEQYLLEMPAHINKWSFDPTAIQSFNQWENKVQELKDFAECRPSAVYQHLLEFVDEIDTVNISVQVPSADTASIFINDVKLPQGLFSGTYIKNQEMRIVASPNIGYEFDNWNDVNVNDTLIYWTEQDSLFVPSFEEELLSILPDTIYSDTTLSLSNSPFYAIKDMVVDSFATLTIESKVELMISPNANIIVNGTLVTQGEEGNEVLFRLNENIVCPEASKWGAIIVENATGISQLTHTKLVASSYGRNRYKEKASINAFNSMVELDHVEVLDAVQPFYSEFGNVTIRDCIFRTELTGDLINIKYADNALVENCNLRGNDSEDTDAIDYDGITNGIIRNNKIDNFFGFNSDGIDLGEGSIDILIEGNTIVNCSDKGISVGQASTALVSQNIIIGCSQGIGIKDMGSFADLDHNTFFGNTYGIAVFEKNAGDGGGHTIVKNTIISQSDKKALLTDDLSMATISYSLSDTDELEDNNNLFTNPEFVNAAILNLELQDSSPCIDAGDPNSPLDPDNTITDIGALFTFQPTTVSDIIINEINYNSGEDCAVADWVELYNKNASLPIDVSGWTLKSGMGNFKIPDNVIIQANSFLVLCEDTLNFQMHHPDVTAIGNFSFGLNNGGAELKLLDKDDLITNIVIYNDEFPWPIGADGYCNTLELYDDQLDNSLPFSWHSSFVNNGTPGASNSIQSPIADLYINELMAKNEEVISDEAGEFDDWIELYNGSANAINLGGLFLTDNLDRKLKWRIPRTNTEETILEAGEYKLLWMDDDIEQGLLHANFRLNASGEELALVQFSSNDTIVLDSISFGVQSSTSTYGQYEDGMGNWQYMKPTPNTTNELFATNTADIGPIINSIKVFPNPTSTILMVKLKPEISMSSIDMFNANGQLINSIVDINKHRKTIDISNLQTGTYLLRIHTDIGFFVNKFIVE